MLDRWEVQRQTHFLLRSQVGGGQGGLLNFLGNLANTSIAGQVHMRRGSCVRCHEKGLNWPEHVLSSVFKCFNHNHYALSPR